MNLKTNYESVPVRKRSFCRTQQSASKLLNRDYQLSNHISSRRNTYIIIKTPPSKQIGERRKSQKKSSKGLFDHARRHSINIMTGLSKNYSFAIPTYVSKQNRQNKESDRNKYYNPTKTLHQMLNQKISKKVELKIKRAPQDYESLNRIVDQTGKMFVNKTKQTKSYMLQERKQYLQRSCGNDNITKLISQFVQTEQSERSRKSKSNKLKKTEAYSISIPNPLESKRVQGQMEEVKEKLPKSPNQSISKESKRQDKEQSANKETNWLQNKCIHSSTQNKPRIKNVRENKYRQQYVVDLDQIEEVTIGKSTSLKAPQEKTKKQLEKVEITKQLKEQKPCQHIPAPKATKKQQNSKEIKAENNQKSTALQMKQRIKQELIEGNKIIDMMTSVGEVASYCSQLLKKSKLNWYVPAVLLYKQCYQKFKDYEAVYIKAAELGLIQVSDRDKFIQENAIIQKNLQKVMALGKKKNKVNEYQKLVNTPQPPNLLTLIQKQVLSFGSAVLSSDQKSNPDFLMCLLRMTNAVKILGFIKGEKLKFIENIDQVDSTKVGALVQKDLQQISSQKLKL